MYSREEETARFSVSGPELQRLNCSQFGVDAGRERVYFLGLHDFHLTNITATNNNLLIGCDANARHTIWGSSEINERESTRTPANTYCRSGPCFLTSIQDGLPQQAKRKTERIQS
ncbi:uncharacterized protein LOC119652236 isoform X2 [Hermetia illucens]|uniref:uncharacterized protein LOC119652236 isoform X2 n=1 Tax=Hermetia illucens TaxID=343691 RepID=UPI0018CC328A|nr:uncharacterized protein LOC119652236 isoform X2 [Hermetia illucens]